jgi:hypothetical protein
VKTLDLFLGAAASERLEPGVDLKLILCSLMTRLATEADTVPSLFESFLNAATKAGKRMSVGDCLDVHLALARLAQNSLPRLDQVLTRVVEFVELQRASAVKISPRDEQTLAELLGLALRAELHDVLALRSFADLALGLGEDAQVRLCL